ncbi:MAG: DUF362 domain-containing protein [Phycisphaerae bacterium]|nr:DUF362 domain-containing protein [Phycisphaerae bacterium]
MSDTLLTRRELLARGAGAVAVAGVAAAGGYMLYDPKGDAGLRKPSDVTLRLKDYFAEIDFPAASPRISVATGSEQAVATGSDEAVAARRRQAVEKMVRAAVGGLDASAGMGRFVSKGDVVLIKPNVGFDRPPHLGATTNPDVLRAVIRLCDDAGAREVIVADNPIEAPEACFARSQIGRVAEETGARVILPSGASFETLVIRDGRPDASRGEALGRWQVFYRPLAEATKVIGVAPIKDHNLCGASMNLKNWYGLLGGRRNQFHQAIHDIVSDLGMMMSPTLVIADGTRVMMRNGPTGGRTSDVKPGGEWGRPAIVASVDPVACDAWCYRHLLGRDPAKLTYLDLAHRKIQAEIAGGRRRFGERDWQVYDRQGKVIITDV